MKRSILFQNAMFLFIVALLALGAYNFSKPPVDVAAQKAEVQVVNAPQAVAGTTFSYQGYLKYDGRMANGSYDFVFGLFDSLTGGSAVGVTQTKSGVNVTDGMFTVYLDFGDVFPGAARYLEISVRPTPTSYSYPADDGVYTRLTPRQQITSVPYAVRAMSSDAGSSSEYWRLGSGSSLGSGLYSGAYLGGNQLNFRTDTTVGQYYRFTPPVESRAIKNVRLLLSGISKTSGFVGPQVMLRIRNLDGTLVATLVTYDLSGAQDNVWLTLLAGASNTIAPTQFLSVEFSHAQTPYGYYTLVQEYHAYLDVVVEVGQPITTNPYPYP